MNLSEIMGNYQKKEFLRNKLMLPIGSESRFYFALLEKYEKYVGGVLVNQAALFSKKKNESRRDFFFGKVYQWCEKNGKIFNITLNSGRSGLSGDLDRVKRKLDFFGWRGKGAAELTVSAPLFLKNKEKFAEFGISASVICGTSESREILALCQRNREIRTVVLGASNGTSGKSIKKISDMFSKAGVQADIFANRGRALRESEREDFLEGSFALKNAFLTREALCFHKFRFARLREDRINFSAINRILEYYAFKKPADLGIIFPFSGRPAGITTAMLPENFHEKTAVCANRCRHCDFCRKAYNGIIIKYF